MLSRPTAICFRRYLEVDRTMKGYSIGRVVQYARYHYTSQTKNYMSLFLACVALPVLFGILSRDVFVAEAMSTAIYTFGGLAFALRTIYPMRQQGMRVMECSLPLSNEERMTFMLFNLVVVYPIFILVTTILGIAIVYPFSDYTVDVVPVLAEVMRETFLKWPLYVFVQMVISASLLLNIVAGRNLFVVYLGAFMGVVAFLGVVIRLSVRVLMNIDPEYIAPIEINDTAARVVYILIPVVFYALSYWALRRRQMKW